MNSVEVKHTCGICDESKERGIYLYHLFICCECEQKIVHTDPKEPEYKNYISKLKHINQPTMNL
ncbi:sigma factor G inhibitor Gin [Aquibacillus salsiterrae]|uniref:Sigma factor G inhibitor Gin n=1 Tax=Aquibacillus salsiterrae TaxID=2950439 RepID=A0A9X3WE02_9BACI|nr:sigma factor G inhibitor Gin [Aquibacillus salsiterrae]MDC3417957.1 sigma factor G inhibitor Gin [Aquibacillus salsiterrae]